MKPYLGVSNVSWGPAKRPPILQPTSFSVEQGKIFVIIGPNGAGKTTLLRTLYRYYKPCTGNVTLEGNNIWELNSRECAQRIGVVLQEKTTDFSMTVREIVTLGRTPYHKSFWGANDNHSTEIVDDAIVKLQLEHLTNRSLITLSGGEKQRVMIARALAQEPDIIILDEPTNYLDIRHQLELIKLLQHLNLTIVCTLHDLNLAIELADKILLLKDGSTLAFGTPAEVITQPLITKAFGVQVKMDTLLSTGQPHFSFHLC